VNVTEDTAMQLLAVYACVRLLCGTLSGLPLECVKTRGPLKQKMMPAPLIVSDPFGGANQLSGRGLTRKQGMSQLMMSLLLRGNGYCWVVTTDEFGRPESLQVIHPDAVDVVVDRETGFRSYRVNNTPVPASRLLHLTGLTQPGYPVGVSVIGAARRAISLGIAAEEYGARFFGTGAHLSGVIRTDADMDNDQARQLAERFAGIHSGMANAHKVGVLSGGAKWEPITVGPEDAQFLGTRAAQNLDIAMLFGVPPHMLGQVDRTTSWGKGIEEQTMGFLKFTLADWAQRFEDAWSAMLPDPWLARFDYDELLRPDATTRWQTYQIARNISALTPNEVRSNEGREPLPGDLGDDAFAPLNSAHSNDPGWTPDGEVPAGSSQPDQIVDPALPAGPVKGQ
jgi:HK97 family phage portal protein